MSLKRVYFQGFLTKFPINYTRPIIYKNNHEGYLNTKIINPEKNKYIFDISLRAVRFDQIPKNAYLCKDYMTKLGWDCFYEEGNDAYVYKIEVHPTKFKFNKNSKINEFLENHFEIRNIEKLKIYQNDTIQGEFFIGQGIISKER